MTLIIDELYDGIIFEQPFRIQRSIQVAHIRPWIYKHGVQLSGDLTLEVWSNGSLLKSQEINYSEINQEIPGTYAHGYIRFDFAPLQLNHDRKLEYTEYVFKLYVSNYTNNTNAFIGASRRYELKFYDTYGENILSNEAPNDMIEPAGFEIYELTY